MHEDLSNLNCNLRGESGIFEKKTAPIFRWSCFSIAGRYVGTDHTPIIDFSGLIYNRF